MDYYKMKTRAMKHIKTLWTKGTERKKIRLAILEEYGLNKKFTDEYLDDLEDTLPD
jgi:hypothetical protein